MSITLTETDKTEISSSAAETFVDAYYTALNSTRSTIPTFYQPTSTSGRLLPHISFNGDLTQDAASFLLKFEKMPFTHFEPQSVNAHVLNPCIDPAIVSKTKKEAERNMSIVVQVSGSVRLNERKEGPLHGFSDSMVLVAGNGKEGGKQKEGRKWVIQAQNLRFVT